MSLNRNIKEQFSTFFDVEEKLNNLKVNNFLKIPNLAKNFERIYQSFPDGTAEDIAKIFIAKMQKNNQTKSDEKNLSAYLEEACFWVVERGELYKQLRLLKLNSTRLDCFQEARKIASQPINIYKTYNFKDSNPMTWGKRQIKREVRKIAYVGREFRRYSTWSVLKYLSDKILIEALKAKSGIKTKKEIKSYVLVVKCYREIYCNSQPKKNEGKLPEPNQTQWEEIQKYYNLRCSEYNKKLSTDESDRLEEITNFQTIKEKIFTCINAANDYIYIDDKTDINLLERNGDNQTEFIKLNHPEREIELEETQQIASICLDEFAKLPLESQKLMQLYYGLEISQTEMKEIFGLQQYQISRKIKRSEKKLLEALGKWSQANLEITPNEEIIKEQNQALKEYLKPYFKQHFEAALEQKLGENNQEKILILRLYYGEKLKLETVAEKLKVSSQTITQEIEIVKQNLEIFLQEWIKEKMDISLSNSRNKRIVSFVEEWLKEEAPYAIWN
ncbi:hypothetical protein [Dapis sp. BLCC M172]|uniref:hypothetical protein n=1 Tax=Dapis sp. BLCC M172 TaxID=2975281 RepID=UPI003CED9986